MIAVRRLALACMGGANGSSLGANTNPCSMLILEEAADDDGDGGWTGGVAALSWSCHLAHDPALLGLLADGGDGDRVGDAGATCHVAHDPAWLRLLGDDEDDSGRE